MKYLYITLLILLCSCEKHEPIETYPKTERIGDVIYVTYEDYTEVFELTRVELKYSNKNNKMD